MSALSRPALFAAGCIALGFVLGWRLKPIAPIAAAQTSNQLAIGVTTARPSVGPSTQNQVATTAVDNPVIARLSNAETYAWIKRRGSRVMMTPFYGENFDTSLAIILNLTPTELEQLETAFKRTGKLFTGLAINAGQSQVSPDGKTLIVSVPSLTSESSPLYTQLIDTVKQVLGPERFSLFNELAGEGFDQSFDKFGLNPKTYELTLQPDNSFGGAPCYHFKITFTDAANSGTNGWSEGTSNRAGLNPVLAHFFPDSPAK